jgi:hypothetical protein
MTEIDYLGVGGVVAMGFDPSEQFLLVISHSGRGVFSTSTWERLARDTELAYPVEGIGIGIGPIEGLRLPVTEMDYSTDKVSLSHRNGSVFLEYESGTITVFNRPQ